MKNPIDFEIMCHECNCTYDSRYTDECPECGHSEIWNSLYSQYEKI